MKKIFILIITGLFPILALSLDPNSDPNLDSQMNGAAGSSELRRIGVETDKNKTADCDTCHAITLNGGRKTSTIAKKSGTSDSSNSGSSKSDGADSSSP